MLSQLPSPRQKEEGGGGGETRPIRYTVIYKLYLWRRIEVEGVKLEEEKEEREKKMAPPGNQMVPQQHTQTRDATVSMC